MAGRNLEGVDLGWANVDDKGEPTSSILERCYFRDVSCTKETEDNLAQGAPALVFFLQQHMQLLTQTATHAAPTQRCASPELLKANPS